MKKSNVVLLAFVFCATLFTTSSLDAKVEAKSVSNEDPGIVCTVRDGETGNVIGRCYLCNCAKFAAAIFGQQ
jgi:hypothetical protein